MRIYMCFMSWVELIEEDQDIDAMFSFFIKDKGFPVTLLRCDRKSKTYRQKNGARIKAAHSVTKDDIIEEASAIVGVR